MNKDIKHRRPSPFQRYALQDQDAARKASMAAELSTHHILHLAAVDRMNDQGHAVFQPGELRNILAKINLKTGERKPITRQAVTQAKKKLYLAGGSSKRTAAGKPASGSQAHEEKKTPAKPNAVTTETVNQHLPECKLSFTFHLKNRRSEERPFLSLKYTGNKLHNESHLMRKNSPPTSRNTIYY